MTQFNLKVVNPIEISNWNKLISNSEEVSIFHAREWAGVLRRTFKYKPCYFIAGGSGDSQLIIPFMDVQKIFKGRGGVSLPFADSVAAIIPDGVNREALFDEIVRLSKKLKWQHICFHGSEKLFPSAKVSSEYFGHLLELDKNTDGIFENFSSSNRSTIRRAKKAGIQIQRSNSLALLDNFYDLHCITRKRQKLPAQPYRFFQNIYKYIITQNLGNTFYAHFEGKIVAAMIFYHFSHRAYWQFSVSDMQHKHLNSTSLALWEAIQWYAAHQYKSMCFGRTDKWNTGLRWFKNKWGAKEYVMKYFRFNLITHRFEQVEQRCFYKTLNMVFGKMPIRASRIVGNIFYRYFA